MDDGLVPSLMKLIVNLAMSLNPYCSGRWSRTFVETVSLEEMKAVLILIVVEDGLVHYSD